MFNSIFNRQEEHSGLQRAQTYLFNSKLTKLAVSSVKFYIIIPLPRKTEVTVPECRKTGGRY